MKINQCTKRKTIEIMRIDINDTCITSAYLKVVPSFKNVFLYLELKALTSNAIALSLVSMSELITAGPMSGQLPNTPQRFSPEELIYGNIKRCIEPFAGSGAILSEELYGDCYRCRVQVRRITDHNGKRRWLISEMFITNYVSENEKGYACIRILQNCIKEYCLYLYLPL